MCDCKKIKEALIETEDHARLLVQYSTLPKDLKVKVLNDRYRIYKRNMELLKYDV